MGASDTVSFLYCPGDLTGSPTGGPDGKVDIKDLATVAKLYGVSCPDSRYNSTMDMNDDCKIDIKDLAMIAKQYGKTC